jgi:hypothetical protein
MQNCRPTTYTLSVKPSVRQRVLQAKVKQVSHIMPKLDGHIL